jgi:hypothetical protein
MRVFSRFLLSNPATSGLQNPRLACLYLFFFTFENERALNASAINREEALEYTHLRVEIQLN